LQSSEAFIKDWIHSFIRLHHNLTFSPTSHEERYLFGYRCCSRFETPVHCSTTYACSIAYLFGAKTTKKLSAHFVAGILGMWLTSTTRLSGLRACYNCLKYMTVNLSVLSVIILKAVGALLSYLAQLLLDAHRKTNVLPPARFLAQFSSCSEGVHCLCPGAR
jgi:hypothetical protein